jgi:hypothetical protein
MVLIASAAVIACGGPGTTSAPSDSSTSSTPTASATPPAKNANGTAGGFGDTSVNPDTQYICAAEATQNDQVIAYTTVAGPDTSGGQGVCTAMEQGSEGAWSDVASISAGSIETTPICWLTAGNDQVTQRVYTAVPGGADAVTRVLCQDLFTGAGVTPAG